jgi:hypothetical protein
MNVINLISLFPEENIKVNFEPDKEYTLPTFLPRRMIFKENSDVPDLEYNDPSSLIIRNHHGYVKGTSEVDFLQLNRSIIEPNIIFDKKGLYNLINTFTDTQIYQELLEMYNKINSNNFILKIETIDTKLVPNLYCDNIFIIRLQESNSFLNYYFQQYLEDPINNNFKVNVEWSPRIRNFNIFRQTTNFQRDQLLIFSLFLFYNNIYISYNENIAKVSLMDMDLFVRNYYLTFINNLMIEPPENDFYFTGKKFYSDYLIRFYNIYNVINNI